MFATEMLTGDQARTLRRILFGYIDVLMVDYVPGREKESRWMLTTFFRDELDFPLADLEAEHSRLKSLSTTSGGDAGVVEMRFVVWYSMDEIYEIALQFSHRSASDGKFVGEPELYGWGFEKCRR